MYIWEKCRDAGQVGSDFLSGRVESPFRRVGYKKSDPWTTLICLYGTIPSIRQCSQDNVSLNNICQVSVFAYAGPTLYGTICPGQFDLPLWSSGQTHSKNNWNPSFAQFWFFLGWITMIFYLYQVYHIIYEDYWFRNGYDWLGSRQQLAKIDTKTMTIGEHSIESSTFAKNLGVTFDSELGMDLHVNNITRSCFYQLRQLRSIRRSLSTDAAKTLVHSLISSRVDYCNSIFYGVTDVVVRRLQSVLNAAARLISNKRKFDHITPVLRDHLHWLPIRQRIDFKIAVFVYNALHGRGPAYLSRICNPVREVGARAHLWSAIRGDLTVPRTRTRRFGPRSFRVSGPVIWNSLPEDIRAPKLSLERFKSMLKTHLFRHAYA